MRKINVKKREQLLSAFSIASPSLKTQRTGLVEEIVRRLQDKQIVGLKAFLMSGKTTIINSVRRKWNPENWGDMHTYSLYGVVSPKILQDHEAKFREQGIALLDEGCAVYGDGSNLARKALVSLIQRLHAEGIPVLMAYHKCSVDKDLEGDFPNMNTVILPPALTREDTVDALTLPFEETGVRLSDSAKARIIELSEGHPTIINSICHHILSLEIKKIRNTTEQIVLDVDPQLTLGYLMSAYVSGVPLGIIEKGLYNGLTKREKNVLERLVKGRDISGYEPEIEELKKWKLIGEGLEVGLVIRTFVEHGYHLDRY
jgi:hypothetical protein